MPTVIRFADGQPPVQFDEDYELVRNTLIEDQYKPIELHSNGSPMLVYPQSVVVVLPKGED